MFVCKFFRSNTKKKKMNGIRSYTCDQSDIIHEPTALDRAIAHGPASQVAWCGGFSLCLHSVSSVDEQPTDLDLMPTPQVAEHCGQNNGIDGKSNRPP